MATITEKTVTKITAVPKPFAAETRKLQAT